MSTKPSGAPGWRLALITLIMLTILDRGMTAHANPKDIPAGAKKVYSFNVIGYPAGRTYTGGCGEGNRIFVNRAASNAQIRITNSTSGWNVLDCNATSDKTATLGTYQSGLLMSTCGSSASPAARSASVPTRSRTSWRARRCACSGRST
jgi:hypothetical protein